MNKNFNILLIQPEYKVNLKMVPPPFGLLFIASALRKAGYFPLIIDLNVQPRKSLEEALRNKDILYAGFSVITGPVIKNVLSLSEDIRKVSPFMPLVWGGPHPSILPEVTVSHPFVDIVVRGEGIRTAVRLAKTLSEKGDLKNVPGINYKEGKELRHTDFLKEEPVKAEDMSSGLEFIDVSPYIFDINGKKGALVLTGRGCPYRCSFCWNSILSERQYKTWDIDRTYEELRPLFASGVNKLFFLDSFAGSIERLEKVGNLLLSENIEWALQDGCRIDFHGRKECFEILERTGCSYMTFGAESGSQKILDLVCKDLKLEDTVRSAEERVSFKLGARYHWMIGFPGETEEDVLKTVALIDRISRINPRSAHNLNMYAPYPGNLLYNKVCDAGWKPPEDLSAWGKYRWDRTYPHHKGKTWYFKSIQYSNLFYRFSDLSKYSIYSEKTDNIFRLAALLLYPFGAVRWKSRIFNFPMEYRIAEKMRKMLE